jgi:hypothetical protein
MFIQKILLEFSDEDIYSFLEICTFKRVKNKAVIIELNKIYSLAFFILKGVIRGYLTNTQRVCESFFFKTCFHNYRSA